MDGLDDTEDPHILAFINYLQFERRYSLLTVQNYQRKTSKYSQF